MEGGGGLRGDVGERYQVALRGHYKVIESEQWQRWTGREGNQVKAEAETRQKQRWRHRVARCSKYKSCMSSEI